METPKYDERDCVCGDLPPGGVWPKGEEPPNGCPLHDPRSGQLRASLEVNGIPLGVLTPVDLETALQELEDEAAARAKAVRCQRCGHTWEQHAESGRIITPVTGLRNCVVHDADGPCPCPGWIHIVKGALTGGVINWGGLRGSKEEQEGR